MRYPPALYGEKAQGNVVLRIFIDSAGHVRPESTVVAAIVWRGGIRFCGGRGGQGRALQPSTEARGPIAVSILFPIYFRHPQAAPVPGDSVLHHGADSVAPRAAAGAQPHGGARAVTRTAQGGRVAANGTGRRSTQRGTSRATQRAAQSPKAPASRRP